jgi:hypothetical protein
MGSRRVVKRFMEYWFLESPAFSGSSAAKIAKAVHLSYIYFTKFFLVSGFLVRVYLILGIHLL